VKRLLIALVAFLVAVPAIAIDRDQRFDDPELQARYERLISEVRCVQCQNNSILPVVRGR